MPFVALFLCNNTYIALYKKHLKVKKVLFSFTQNFSPLWIMRFCHFYSLRPKLRQKPSIYCYILKQRKNLSWEVTMRNTMWIKQPSLFDFRITRLLLWYFYYIHMWFQAYSLTFFAFLTVIGNMLNSSFVVSEEMSNTNLISVHLLVSLVSLNVGRHILKDTWHFKMFILPSMSAQICLI